MGKVESHSWITPLGVSFFFLLLSVVGFCVKKPYVDWIFLAVQTAIGLFLTYLVVFSNLPCTEWNWLLIPLNPLPIIFWRWRGYWATVFVLILVVWVAFMLLSSHQLTDSAYIVFVIALIFVFLKQSRAYACIYNNVTNGL